MKIALNKRIRSLELYLRNNCSFTAFKAKWKILYQGELLPSRKYMQRLLKKFRTHGDLNKIKRNRKNTSRRNDIVTDISAFYQMNQGTSLRNFIRDENPRISLSTLRKILREDLGFHNLLSASEGGISSPMSRKCQHWRMSRNRERGKKWRTNILI